MYSFSYGIADTKLYIGDTHPYKAHIKWGVCQIFFFLIIS